jgi:hypothetical protein
MDAKIEERQLLRSCEILFGAHLNISWEFLEYLQLSGLKGAYRRRALETHPDRLIRDNLPTGTGCNENFHRVRQAYEQLFRYLKIKENHPLGTEGRPPTTAAPSPPGQGNPSCTGPGNGTEWSAGKGVPRQPYSRPTVKPAAGSPLTRRAPEYSPTENLYCGPLPHRRLLFGHFLYYSGLANWRTITRILTWQRTERPRLGELGCRFGMLRQEDITCILRAKVPLQKFGQTASTLGILNNDQVRVLLVHQQRLQKKFGTILLEKNLIDSLELQGLLNQFEQHNAGIPNTLRGL